MTEIGGFCLLEGKLTHRAWCHHSSSADGAIHLGNSALCVSLPCHIADVGLYNCFSLVMVSQ